MEVFVKYILLIVCFLLFLSYDAYALEFDVNKTYESVFIISSEDSVGSGFAINSKYIITNAHVIKNENNTFIHTYNGNKHIADVEIVDTDLDIAVLKVSDAELTYIKVADYNLTGVGEDVYIIGSPVNLSYSMTKGILSAKDRRIENNSYLQVNANVNPGNSGGPLLNGMGYVIGVNTFKVSDSEGIGLAVPMTEVCDMLNENGITYDFLSRNPGASPDIGQNNVNNESEAAYRKTNTDLYRENLILKIILSGLTVINVILSVLTVIIWKRRSEE